MPARRAGRARSHARRLVLAGGDDHLGAGRLERVGRGRGAARETTTVSGTSAARARAGSPAAGGPRSRTRSGAAGGGRPRSRAVSSGSSASAVPIPTATASHSARQWWASRRESSPEIHFESPVRVATLPSSVIADLKSTRAAGAGVLAERLVEQPRPGGQLAVGDHDLDALVAQDPEPAAGGLLGRVVGGDDHARDAGLEDRVRARRRLAVVAARLERDVHRRAARVGVAAGRGERLALGVRPAVGGVEALAEHLAVADDDGADHRIGRHAPAPALGELDRAREVRGRSAGAWARPRSILTDCRVLSRWTLAALQPVDHDLRARALVVQRVAS